MPNSETLKKLEYNDIRQFIEDINHNFAILQNSPFFKGVPGKKGQQGIRGVDGERGIKFFIVKYAEFEKKFPGKFKNSNNINLVEINKLLENHNNKLKLLEIFSIKDFVKGDIILLENTKMLQLEGDKFVDTNISLNNTEILQDVQSQIERILVKYLERDTLVQVFKNIFFQYESHAKNYADTSNKPPISTITPKTIFEPHTGDYKSGIKLEDHKFIAIDKDLFGVESNINTKTTTILGNLKRFIQLSQNTINESIDKSFSSDYGIGMNNLPSLVVMQNDYNSGILIGSKDYLNLGKFSKIYTDQVGDLVLQNQTSPNAAEINRLKVTQSSVITDKNLIVHGSTEISGDTILNNSVGHKFFRSGTQLHFNYNDRENWFELGNRYSMSKMFVFMNQIRFSGYSDKILTTDRNEYMSSQWSINRRRVNFGNGLDAVNDSELTNFSITNTLPTSESVGDLMFKVNDICKFVKNNYYTKSDFANPAYVIPTLYLRDRLSIQNQFEVNNNLTTVNTPIQFLKDRIAFNQLRNRVLITDSNGYLLNNFFIDYGYQNNTISSTDQTYNDKVIITGKQFTDLAHRIIVLKNELANNYWSKAEWDNWTLPKNLWVQNLATSHSFRVSRPHNERYPVFKAEYDSRKIELHKIERFHLGVGSSNSYSGPLVFIDSYIDKEQNGKLDIYYSHNVYANADAVFDQPTGPRNDVRAMVGKHLEALLLRFNAIRDKFYKYFTKDELQNYGTTLHLNGLKSKFFELWHGSTPGVWWHDNILKFINNASISLQHTRPGDIITVRSNGTLGGTKSIYVQGMVCAFYLGSDEREVQLNSLGWYRCDGSVHNGFRTPNIPPSGIVKNSNPTENGGINGSRSIRLTKNHLPAHEHDTICFSAGNHNHRYIDTYYSENTGVNAGVYGSNSSDSDNNYLTRNMITENNGTHTHDILVFGGGNERDAGDEVNIEPYGTYLTYMCYCG